MPAVVETMFSARERPWHGLGTIVEEQLTAADALRESGLDWKVEKHPIFVEGESGSYVEVPGKYANRRDSDGRVLGVVGEQYQILQNEDAFSFADALVDSGDAKYETAGSLRDGRRVWLMMTLPEGVKVAGDDIDIFIALANSHDGSQAVTVMATPIRVVCQNTLNLAIGQAKRTWSVRHTASMDGRLDEARRALELTFDYAEEFAKVGEELAAEKISDGRFERIVEELTDVEKHAEGILATYQTSPNLEDIRGTKWGALNAVGEYFDWGRNTRSQEARLKSSLTGTSRRMRDEAYTLLTA